MNRIQRILCPTDFTSESDAALLYAIAIARTYDARLFVCHCVESPAYAELSPLDLMKDRLDIGISHYLGTSEKNLEKCEKIIIEGDPVIAIPRAAAEHHIDLIVMRSRRRPIAATLLGSTAEAICRTAPCPVLVTHPSEHEWAGIDKQEISLKRILIAHDFSNDAELALQYGLSLAQEHQAEVHLLHVLPYTISPALTGVPTGLEKDFERAARLLKDTVPEETNLWCRISQSVASGQPYREILTYAIDKNIDLICMGVHGAGFSMRALFGSNADRVLRQAPCPVLIARPLKPALSIAP